MNQRRRVSLLRLILVFCVFLITYDLSLMTAEAQSATATLSGEVADERGAVIPGASVTATNVNTKASRQTTTNGDGYFVIPLLPPSTYVLAVEGKGFAPLRIENVILNVGDQKALQIQLKAGNISEMVQIEGNAPLINESPAVGTTIDRQFVGNLPLNGRSFQTLITLTPGVVLTKADNNAPGQFSVNGQRANANYFTVDGVSANIGLNPSSGIPGEQLSGSVPALTTFGGTNSLVSVDALEEFKIQTSTYAPEFGRSPGGQVSLVTRAGTKDFHGSLFEYFRNEVLDANDWFNNSLGLKRSALRQNQFGATFSGPVFWPRFGEGGPVFAHGTKRTFFFFSYEGLRLRQPQTRTTSVPSLRIRQQAAPSIRPFLDALPLPTDPEFVNSSSGQPTGAAPLIASWSDPQVLNATSIRVDHTIGSKALIFGRFNNSRSTGSARSERTPSSLSITSNTTRTLTVGATMSISPRLSNELRINYSSNSGLLSAALDNFGGAVPVSDSLLFPAFASPATGQSGVLFIIGGASPFYSVGQPVDSYQRQVNIINNVSLTTGSHQLKFGIDYRRLAPVYGPKQFFRQMSFQNEADIRNGIITSLTTDVNTGARPIFVNFSTFGQDTWRISSRLTMTYGLRWELNPPPSEANGKKPVVVSGLNNPATATLAPSGTALYQTTYNNFAPRIGLSYLLSPKTGLETVLRGGFGVFYDLGNSTATNVFTSFPFTARKSLSRVPFPIPPTQDVPTPLPSVTLPISDQLYVFDPNLKLPYTLQWNVAVEQALGKNQSASASYVAAAGRRLLSLRLLQPYPNFARLLLTTNEGTSNYQSLQLQYQRRLSRGLQALANYTWSHAIDVVSDDLVGLNVIKGDAAFDIRHNLSSAITYNLPTLEAGRFGRALLGHWSIDAIVRAQSGLPFSITTTTAVDEFGRQIAIRPNLILGVPLYVKDPTVPGGRRVNRAAFQTPPAGQQGSLGRNTLRELPVYQVDFTLRRQFNVTERVNLQFRFEAFNVFNHPNFSGINTTLSSGLFGQPTRMLGRSLGGLNALYQIGGPRSLQFGLKFNF